MFKTIIKYAIDKTTQKVVHIDDVPKGLACNCICAECGSDFVAVKGEFRKKHFRHHNQDTNCKGGLETAIHKLAKEIILNNKAIQLLGYTLNYTEPKQETGFGGFIPDVTVISDNKPVLIEIFVRHQCEPDKIEYYKAQKINSFEIDLSKVDYKTSKAELENLVLKGNNKKIIYWESAQMPQNNTKQDNNWLGVLAAILGFLFLRNLLKRK